MSKNKRGGVRAYIKRLASDACKVNPELSKHEALDRAAQAWGFGSYKIALSWLNGARSAEAIEKLKTIAAKIAEKEGQSGPAKT